MSTISPPVALRSAEAAGYLDLFAAAPQRLVDDYGIVAREIGGAACVSVAGLPDSRMLNHVIDLDGAIADEELDAIAAFYRDAGAGHVVAVTARAAALGLEDRLIERGYAADYAWVVFDAPPAERWPAQGSLRAARITGVHRLRFGEIIAGGFGLPADLAGWLTALVGRESWSCFVVLDGGELVAAGALFVSGETAWMALGATLPAHRGRGAQALLIAARRAEAHRLGCARVVTETGAWTADRPNTSYRNILRGGFDVVASRPNFRAPA